MFDFDLNGDWLPFLGLLGLGLSVWLLPMVLLQSFAQQAVTSLQSNDNELALARYQKLERWSWVMLLGGVRDNFRFVAVQGAALAMAGLHRPAEVVPLCERSLRYLANGVQQPPIVIASVHSMRAASLSRLGKDAESQAAIADAQQWLLGLKREDAEAAMEHIRLLTVDGSIVCSQAYPKRVLDWIKKLANQPVPPMEELVRRVIVSQSQLAIAGGRYDDARDILAPMLGDFSHSATGKVHSEAWEAMSYLTLATNDLKGHVHACEQTLDCVRASGAEPWMVSASEISLATAHSLYGNHREALDAATRAHDRFRSARPNDQANLRQFQVMLATHCRVRGDYQRCDELLRQIEMQPESSLETQALLLPISLSLRGVYWIDYERFDLAIEHLSKGVAHLARLQESRTDLTIDLETDLAYALIRNGELPSAKPYIEQAEAALAESSTIMVIVRAELQTAVAAYQAALGNPSAADARLRQAKEVLTDVVHPDHRQFAKINQHRGRVEAMRGEHVRAIELYSAAASNRLKTAREDHPCLHSNYIDWAESLSALGRDDEASAMQARATRIADRHPPLIGGLWNPVDS